MDPTLHLVLRAAFALLLGAAAWHKARDPRRFVAVLEGYDVVPRALVVAVATLVVVVECALATALASGFAAAATGVATATLMAMYAAAIHLNLRRGRSGVDCGCLGPAARVPMSGALVVRNIVLASGASLLVLPVSLRPLGTVDLGVVLAATAVLALCWQATANLLVLAPRAAALKRRGR